jgi:gliding motility-associated-like protein
MRYLFLFTFSAYFLFNHCLYAQAPAVEWQKCLGGGGGDYGHSIVPTSDGGYISAGYTGANGGDVTGFHGSNIGIEDYWVVKLNSTGTIQWQRSLGGTYMDQASVIRQTADGGYIVGGHAASKDGDVAGNHGGLDFWLVKLNATGNIQWQKSLGGSKNEYCWSLDITSDGGYIMAGSTESDDGDITGNHGARDYWVVKLSSTGNLQWQKCLGGINDEDAWSVKQVADGGYIVGGRSKSNEGDVTGNHGNEDYWIVKLTNTGGIEWQKSLGGSNIDWANSVLQATDGGYIVGGSSRSADGNISAHHSNSGWEDYWIVKLSSTGTLEWEKSLGGNYNDMAFSVAHTPDGGYIIAGYSESIDGDITCHTINEDYWIVKINNTGNIQWQKVVGGKSVDKAYSVAPAPDGGYIVTGFTGSTDLPGYHSNASSLAGDFFVVKLSAEIVTPVLPQVTISTPPSSVCSGTSVTLTTTTNYAGTDAVYSWKKNGSLVGGNSSSYTASDFVNGDVVVCYISIPGDGACRITTQSNPVVMNITGSNLPGVSITADKTSICGQGTVTFTAVITNGNPLPVYKWILNGNNTGVNSNTYSSSALNNGDVVSLEYSDNTPCLAGSFIISNAIQIQVTPFSTPAVSIIASATTVCSGEQVIFSSTATNAGPNPSYQWAINGVNAGANNKTFATTSLLNGDRITCTITNDPALACVINPGALSNSIVIAVKSTATPSVSITSSDNDICEGTRIVFTALAQNAGTIPSYQWIINGIALNNNNTEYSTATLKDGDQVQCKLIPGSDACPALPVTSNFIMMRIKQLPVITINPADTTIAPGHYIKLNTTVQGTLAYYAWAPSSSLQDPLLLSPVTIGLNEQTIFTLSVKSTEGCIATKEVTVKVAGPVFMPNAFTPNGDGLNDIFRIPPNVSLKLTHFSIFDRWGNQVFSSRDIGKGWNGLYKGTKVDSGVYIYLIKGSNEKGPVLLKGSFVLVR